MQYFQQLPHTADIKMRAYGKTKQDLFIHALQGMFQLMRPYAQGCERRDDLLVCNKFAKQHTVVVESLNMQSLLIDFLSEALWRSDAYNEIYLNAHISVMDDTHIQATLYGVSVTGYEGAEIKAVTYHDASIVYEKDMWQADIVFDI